MAAAEGLVQVAPDSTGKKLEAFAVTIPAGTVVTNADGSLTTLTADTIFYRQSGVIVDASSQSAGGIAEVKNSKLQVEDRTLAQLMSMGGTLEEILFLLKGALS